MNLLIVQELYKEALTIRTNSVNTVIILFQI